MERTVLARMRLTETPESLSTKRWLRTALIVWGVLCVLGVGRAALHYQPRHQGCYPVFHEGGLHWWRGESLYDQNNLNALNVFRYSPLVATLLVPLAWLPPPLGSAWLRLANLAVLLCGLLWWGRTSLPPPFTARHRALLALLVVPLAVPSVLDVQLNSITLGLMLITIAAATAGRWNVAALAVSVAICFKAYPIALALVLVAVYPRQFTARWLLALAGCLLLPSVTREPGYVLRQYQEWVQFGLNGRYFPGAFQDGQFLWNLWLPTMDRRTYGILEVAIGGAIALYCWLLKRRGVERGELLRCVFGMCCAWMLALGPSTEATTYLLLAPAVALAVLLAWTTPQPLWYRAAVGLAFLLLAGSYLQLLFPLNTPLHKVAAQPFAALLFLAALAVQGLRKSRNMAPSATEFLSAGATRAA